MRNIDYLLSSREKIKRFDDFFSFLLEKDIVYLKTKTIMKNTMNEIDEGFHLT
jgi:hypothetical protein